jgi:hypothetical protein
MPFPLLAPLLAIKGVVVARFVYRHRIRARADRQFRCKVVKEGSATGHIDMRIGTRDVVVYSESSLAADFVISRGGMKWMNGEPVEVTDEDLKLIRTTLSAWAQARGSTMMML